MDQNGPKWPKNTTKSYRTVAISGKSRREPADPPMGPGGSDPCTHRSGSRALLQVPGDGGGPIEKQGGGHVITPYSM